jgi:hypothetical protein
MSNTQHQDSLSVTAACTVRLLETSIADDDEHIHVVQANAWFGSVRASSVLGTKGHRAVLQVKNNKALFPKEFRADALQDAPGGVHIALTGKAPNGVDLLAIGYRYSTKNTFLFFVARIDAGSTTPGKPYEMKYNEDHGNVCIYLVEHPDIISKFFHDSNAIDKHNQSR